MQYPPRLNQSIATYRSIINQMDHGYILVDVMLDETGKCTDIYYLEANDAANRMAGVELVGKRMTELDPEYHQSWYDIFGRVALTGVTENHELTANVFGICYKVRAFKVGETQERKVAVLYEDLTQSHNAKAAEREMRNSEHKYQVLFESMDEGYCIIQMIYDDNGKAIDFKYLEVNPAFERHNGLANATGKTIREVAPDIEDKWIDIYNRVAETGESIRFEEDSEALKRIFDLYAFRIGEPEERKVAVLFSNITDRKMAEMQLHEVEIDQKMRLLEEEKQREIFRITLQTQEEERQRMAESLHNGLGQVLYGVKISLAGLSPQQTEAEFNKTKNYTSQLLTEAINESRRISHDLMPATLEEFGLKSAIHDICEQFQKKIHFTCNIQTDGKRFEKYLELAIYRAVQELMINVVKHAKAKAASVSITIHDKIITIKVADNGVGMEATRGNKPGIGLKSIHSKMRLLNGDVKVSSEANKGTTIEITVPMR